MAREVHLLRPCGSDQRTQDVLWPLYLQTEAGILPCLDKERLRELDQEFIQKLEAKQVKLTMKRS